MSLVKLYGLAHDFDYLYIPIRGKIDPYTKSLAHCACMPGWFGESTGAEEFTNRLECLERAIYEESQKHIGAIDGIDDCDMVFYTQDLDTECFYYLVKAAFQPGSVSARTAFDIPIVRGMDSSSMQYPLFPAGTVYEQPHNLIFSSILQIRKTALSHIFKMGLVDFMCSEKVCMEISNEEFTSLDEFRFSPEKEAFDTLAEKLGV